MEVYQRAVGEGRRGELDESEAVRAIAALSGGGQPELRDSPPLTAEAFRMARRLDHPVYDCVYVVLAEELDLPLVTADERLVAAVQPTIGERCASSVPDGARRVLGQ